MPDRYLIITAQRDYLPESEPFVLTCDPDRAAVPQVLEYIRAEIEHAAPESPDGGAWDDVLVGIDNDLENAAGFSPEAFRYDTPDGYSIEATLKTDAELTSLGYELEEA